MKALFDERRCKSANVEVPAGFCRKLADSLLALKERLIVRYEEALPERRHLVGDLIAEAEALAWETPFPHLFLPDLADVRFKELLATQPPPYAQAA
jgi:hypothetical protein